MEDQEIIGLFWRRSENAIVETDRKYGKLCFQTAFRILGSREDSEECVSDTYLRAWEAIPPQKPDVLPAFLCRITRNLALNRYEKLNSAKRGRGVVPVALEELSECIPDPNTVEREVDNRMLGLLLNQFLASLPMEARKVFLLRYWELVSVREIAKRLGISESKVKVSLYRTRGKLRKFLEQEEIAL
jgi:RNA polymerase sigma-70 factor (ECF subfamily)